MRHLNANEVLQTNGGFSLSATTSLGIMGAVGGSLAGVAYTSWATGAVTGGITAAILAPGSFVAIPAAVGAVSLPTAYYGYNRLKEYIYS